MLPHRRGKLQLGTSRSSSTLLSVSLAPIFLLLCFLGCLAWTELYASMTAPSSSPSTSVTVKQRTASSSSSSSYRGEAWSSPLLVSRAVLHSTPFARCEVHSVYSEDRSKVQEDWLWLDELDHVNVVVYDRAMEEFVMFNQRKYAIEGETLAVVGGFLGAGEDGFAACRREVKEEVGYTSPAELRHLQTGEPYDPNTDPAWVVLGRYRAMANRGGGFLTSCLLRDAVPIPAALHAAAGFEGLGTGFGIVGDEEGQKDGEAQDIVRMKLEDMRTALLENKFKEVKWTASVA
eukprot:CAMPEP_0182456930 /NCGR_PEP_ID=MMETSP1319-20130603/2634_1 /TAXON_ID=172717 /ORGANISM="Bolidomonas pacifica, Strain RCC208" /LENGTH=289 /DNA_ID=CAMNT_0024655287 /DNA_START=68 /DNA_END=934 /DNA_ORIENTATION=-